jgi:hypothetical protein
MLWSSSLILPWRIDRHMTLSIILWSNGRNLVSLNSRYMPSVAAYLRFASPPSGLALFSPLDSKID